MALGLRNGHPAREAYSKITGLIIISDTTNKASGEKKQKRKEKLGGNPRSNPHPDTLQHNSLCLCTFVSYLLSHFHDSFIIFREALHPEPVVASSAVVGHRRPTEPRTAPATVARPRGQQDLGEPVVEPEAEEHTRKGKQEPGQ